MTGEKELPQTGQLKTIKHIRKEGMSAPKWMQNLLGIKTISLNQEGIGDQHNRTGEMVKLIQGSMPTTIAIHLQKNYRGNNEYWSHRSPKSKSYKNHTNWDRKLAKL